MAARRPVRSSKGNVPRRDALSSRATLRNRIERICAEKHTIPEREERTAKMPFFFCFIGGFSANLNIVKIILTQLKRREGVQREVKLTTEQWIVARDEYVHNPEVSYRYLSDKYKVSLVTVNNRAQKEGWQELRARYVREKEEREKNSPVKDCEADLYALSKQLGQKLAVALATVDPNNVSALRSLTSSVKDLMEIQLRFKDGSEDNEGTGIFLLPGIEASEGPPIEEAVSDG